MKRLMLVLLALFMSLPFVGNTVLADDISGADTSQYSEEADFCEAEAAWVVCDALVQHYANQHNQELVLTEFNDKNNDGIYDGIFATKDILRDSGSKIDNIYYVHYEGGKFNIVGALHYTETDPIIEDARIIRVSTIKEPVLCVNTQLTYHSRGIILYRLDKNMTKIHEYSPTTDNKYIKLYDDPDVHDGEYTIYEGLEETAGGRDYYYHDVRTKLTFLNQGELAFKNASLIDYADEIEATEPKDVAMEYACLASIKDGIRNAAGEIMPVGVLEQKMRKISNVPFSEEYVMNHELLENSATGYIVPNYQFVQEIYGDDATVFTYIDFDESSNDNSSVGDSKTLIFELKKIEGKWIIVSIREGRIQPVEYDESYDEDYGY